MTQGSDNPSNWGALADEFWSMAQGFPQLAAPERLQQCTRLWNWEPDTAAVWATNVAFIAVRIGSRLLGVTVTRPAPPPTAQLAHLEPTDPNRALAAWQETFDLLAAGSVSANTGIHDPFAGEDFRRTFAEHGPLAIYWMGHWASTALVSVATAMPSGLGEFMDAVERSIEDWVEALGD